MITDINGRPIEGSLKEDGYVIIDDLISTDMFTKLTDACDRVVNRARKGDWEHRYVV